MVGSHTRCKVCRVATVHKTSRFGLCPKHERLHNQARRLARRRVVLEEGQMPKVKPVVAPRPNRFETKALQDAVLSAAPVAEDEVIVEALVDAVLPEHIVAARRRLDLISDERKLEIAGHYEDYSIPTRAIKDAYSLSSAMLTMIVQDLGIKMRGTGNKTGLTQGHFDMEPGGKFVWVVEDQVPPPVHKALENMLKLPAQPEPLASTPLLPDPPANRLLSFEVTVHGTFRVAALDIMSAMQKIIRDYPDLRVTGILEQG